MDDVKILLDSCVVIELMEKRSFGRDLISKLRGKRISFVLCDIVLREVQRVKGFDASCIRKTVSNIVRKKVILESVGREDASLATEITHQLSFCHRGDNLILSLCKSKDFVLLTLDRMLLRASEIVGVAAFHPSMARGV